mmetsp:Transcript_38368/g.101817  ORF Transcript_38368/g.101817 Transcript_38368/m.101817 type:complete len:96 (-) Transcript_38368:88-375(-)
MWINKVTSLRLTGDISKPKHAIRIFVSNRYRASMATELNSSKRSKTLLTFVVWRHHIGLGKIRSSTNIHSHLMFSDGPRFPKGYNTTSPENNDSN